MQNVVLLIKPIVFDPVVVVVASAPHWLKKWQVWKLLVKNNSQLLFTDNSGRYL